MVPRVDNLYVQAGKVPGVSCCNHQVSCLGKSGDKRVGQRQIPAIDMRPFPERSGLFGVAALDRKYALIEVHLELEQPVTQSCATEALLPCGRRCPVLRTHELGAGLRGHGRIINEDTRVI